MADDTSPIPPSPSAADYNADGDRPLIPHVDEPFELLKQWLLECMKRTEVFMVLVKYGSSLIASQSPLVAGALKL